MLTIPVSILVGWLAARARIHDEPWDRVKALHVTAALGITVGALGAIPSALAHLNLLPYPTQVSYMFSALGYATGVAGGVGYAALFGLIAVRLDPRDPTQLGPRTAGPGPQHPREIRAYGRPARTPADRTSQVSVVERSIAAMGKRSLTFYLYQSLIFMIVLSATRFGLGDRVSSAVAFLIAVLTWASSIPLALWLEKGNRRGPAEALLRRITYGKALPQKSTPRPLPDPRAGHQ